jgi:transcriptional regulator with XRE-family HTH domain
MGTKITGFEDRLRRLLAGRKFYPWGAALGISTGTLARMAKGLLPTAETLAPISEIEGVSLSWLVCENGAPYTIRPAASAAAMIDDWDIALEEAQPIVVTDGERAAVVAQTENSVCAFTHKRFTRVNVWSRFIGREEADYLVQHYRDRMLLRQMATADLDALVGGELGPAQFCGWTAGEFKPWQPASREWPFRDPMIHLGMFFMEEAPAGVSEPASPTYPSDQERIAALAGKLTDAERTFVIHMLSGLASPRR